MAEIDRLKGNRERVVILGSGWGGYVLSRQLDLRKYQCIIVSPRSYFVFTPLLSGTCVGTLEFRNVLEPVRDRQHNLHYMQAWGDAIDLNAKTIRVEESLVDEAEKVLTANARYKNLTSPGEKPIEVNVRQGTKWDVSYDKLVVAVGCYNQTFNTPGVKENAFFLKDAGDARRIRTRVLECFELAALPTTSDAMKRTLLHFAIVGGGPTGMEFAAELSDLVHKDMGRLYPGCKKYVKVTVYDVASKILSMFDEKLEKYAEGVYRRQGVSLRTSHHVEELRPGLPELEDGSRVKLLDAQGCYTLKTKEEGEVGVGICVWSTGLMMNPLVEREVEKSRQFPTQSAIMSSGETNDGQDWKIQKHAKTHGFVVNDQLRVQIEGVSGNAKDAGESAPKRAVLKDVFALGDNCVVEGLTMPATAQTANQEALWLAKRLNKGDLEKQHFKFRNLGVMAYIGGSKALFQGGKAGQLSGRAAWILWRTAYFTMALSYRNKLVIPFYWFVNWIFGRDISRF